MDGAEYPPLIRLELSMRSVAQVRRRLFQPAWQNNASDVQPQLLKHWPLEHVMFALAYLLR